MQSLEEKNEIEALNDLAHELASASFIAPLQPNNDLIFRIEAQPSIGDQGVYSAGEIPRSELPYQPPTAIVKDWVPYYPYYALRDGSSRVVHPMAMGRFILNNSGAPAAADVIAGVLQLAHRLPNKGLAWYYPRHYQVARMLGHKLKYSSIAQGTIIAGLTRMAQSGSSSADLAADAFNAMLWPFEKGGINLADKAVLEMPSFAGPPEIILNGWIDALLHIRDYGDIAQNKAATKFFKKNVSFLSKIISNFHCSEAGISRYSDLCPYRLKVRLSSPADVATLQVYYRPKVDGLPPIKVDLKPREDEANFSVYENQILRQNGKEAFVWISCSQLYDTVLVSSSTEMTVTIPKGIIGRKSSGPGVTGEILTFESIASGGLRSVTLSSSNGLICGYPTNFLKGGTHNYYHAYHVVGLLLIAASKEVTKKDRQKLTKWALRWKKDLERIESTEGLEFRPLDKMLEDINANRAKISYTNIDDLLEDAEAFIA